jgi:CheY-like chemotaxis protein
MKYLRDPGSPILRRSRAHAPSVPILAMARQLPYTTMRKAHEFSNSILGTTPRRLIGTACRETGQSASKVQSSLPGIGLTIRDTRCILAIEDSPTDLLLLQLAFERSGRGHRLQHLPDGEQALLLLDQLTGNHPDEFPDVIVLDLNLPRVDGFELLARLRSTEALRAIAVMVLTSSGSEAERCRALSEGADVYCTKPLSLEEYLRLPDVIEEARKNRNRRIQQSS